MDSGEEAVNALKREFCEEALNSEEATEEQKQDMTNKLETLFKDGKEVRMITRNEYKNSTNCFIYGTFLRHLPAVYV